MLLPATSWLIAYVARDEFATGIGNTLPIVCCDFLIGSGVGSIPVLRMGAAHCW
jgi:hypothetical protein